MSENYYPEFAAHLVRYLADADRSASWLARRLQMNPGTVSRWLNGESRPNSPELIIRIADILGVPTEQRQQLLLAAGYAFLSQAPQSATTDAASLLPTVPSITTAAETPTNIDAKEAIPQAQDQIPTLQLRLTGVLSASWRQWRTNSQIRWAAVAGLGLLLLLGLNYPLLWEWPVARACVSGSAALIFVGALVWQRRWQRLAPSHTDLARWPAKVGAGTLLVLALALWVEIGIPKLYGRWTYSSRNENGDRFGYAIAGGDFNGDGHADLAISAVGEAPTLNRNARTGWVYLFDNNQYDNLVPGLNLGQAGLGSNEQGDRFGWALAKGDFNGDGLDDLAVSAPGESLWGTAESGYIYVFRGTPYGLAPWTSIDQHLLGANENNDRFGWTLAAADFNRDGKDDLAIGAPYEQPGIMAHSGYVFIFTGRSYGFQQWFGIRQEGLAPDEDGDLFGWALAAGDFNGDGMVELAVGAPGDRDDQTPSAAVMGQVFIFQCNPKEGPQPWRVLTPSPSDTITAERFGAALVAGDFTGDGLDDLAVGAPGQTPDTEGALPVAGATYLFQGQANDITAWATVDASAFTQTQEMALFGWALASADFNGDYKADLAVSAPNHKVSTADGAWRSGAVFTFRSRGTQLEPWAMVTEPTIAQDQSDDWFGWSMTTMDIDKDHRAELIVGAPGARNARSWVAGYVYPFRFANSGIVAVQGLQQ